MAAISICFQFRSSYKQPLLLAANRYRQALCNLSTSANLSKRLTVLLMDSRSFDVKSPSQLIDIFAPCLNLNPFTWLHICLNLN